MKLIHTSDWHLGKYLYSRSMLEEQEAWIFGRFLPLVEAQRPDAVLLAGDVYDRQIAPVEALTLFDRFVTALCGELGIGLIAVSGNHDSPQRMQVGADLLARGGCHIITRLDPEAPPIVLAGPRPVHIYTLPYFDPAMARYVLGREELQGFAAAYEAVLAPIRSRLDPNACNLLVAHCFAAGSRQAESESPMFVGGSGQVPPAAFADFDYVALGHLHGPQRVGENGRYSGTPLAYSFDEAGQEKGVVLVEIPDAGPVQTRHLPLPPRRALRTVEGTLESLRLAAAGDPNADDFIFARLTGNPIFEPMAQLRKFYPNTLEVHNGDLVEERMRRAADGGTLNPEDPRQLFTEFFRQMCGEETTPEDLAVFEQAWTQANGEGGAVS